MSCEWFIKPPPPCECCKRHFRPKRIGVSAIGWAFGFDLTPGGEPGTMDSWRPHLADAVIEDEYGREYTAVEFEEFVRSKETGKSA